MTGKDEELDLVKSMKDSKESLQESDSQPPDSDSSTRLNPWEIASDVSEEEKEEATEQQTSVDSEPEPDTSENTSEEPETEEERLETEFTQRNYAQISEKTGLPTSYIRNTEELNITLDEKIQIFDNIYQSKVNNSTHISRQWRIGRMLKLGLPVVILLTAGISLLLFQMGVELPLYIFLGVMGITIFTLMSLYNTES